MRFVHRYRPIWGFADLGKTLNVGVSQFFAIGWRQVMYTLFSQVFRFLPFARAVAPVHGVAHNLMERAEAGAGRNPQQAQELRRAARAYLSVVR
jgi:hypothetical protein